MCFQITLNFSESESNVIVIHCPCSSLCGFGEGGEGQKGWGGIGLMTAELLIIPVLPKVSPLLPPPSGLETCLGIFPFTSFLLIWVLNQEAKNSNPVAKYSQPGVRTMELLCFAIQLL